jgi:hypothetical protein
MARGISIYQTNRFWILYRRSYSQVPVGERKDAREEDRRRLASLLLRTAKDCYQVTRSDILQRVEGGQELLRRYGDSHERALCNLFPEHALSPWHFPQTPSFWDNEGNQRLFLLWLQALHGWSPEEVKAWDNLKTPFIVAQGGAPLLERYGGSLWKAVYHLLPDRRDSLLAHWQRHQAHDLERVRFILEVKREELNVSSPLDWASLTTEQRRNHLGDLIDAYGGLIGLLSSADPSLEWSHLFDNVKQSGLKHIINSDKEAYKRVQKERSWKNTVKVRNLLLRIRASFSLSTSQEWEQLNSKPEKLFKAIPEAKEALSYYEGSLLSMRDSTHLPEVPPFPYRSPWNCPRFQRDVWRQLSYSLDLPLEQIYQSKFPHQKIREHPLGYLILHRGGKKLLPLVHPKVAPARRIPLISTNKLQVTSSAPLQLSKYRKWDPFVDPTGSWMIPVPRGIRAMWDGESLSSLRCKIDLPSWVKKALPSEIPLDLVVSHPSHLLNSPQWLNERPKVWSEGINLCIIDAITSEPVEKRHQQLRSLTSTSAKKLTHYEATGVPILSFAPSEKCVSPDHFYDSFEELTEKQFLAPTSLPSHLLLVSAHSHYGANGATILASHFATGVATLQEMLPGEKSARGLVTENNITIDASYDEGMLPYLRQFARSGASFLFSYIPGKAPAYNRPQLLYFLPTKDSANR